MRAGNCSFRDDVSCLSALSLSLSLSLSLCLFVCLSPPPSPPIYVAGSDGGGDNTDKTEETRTQETLSL